MYLYIVLYFILVLWKLVAPQYVRIRMKTKISYLINHVSFECFVIFQQNYVLIRFKNVLILNII